ncbi:MAG: hypothetical protein MUF06_24240 [Pirellulaceae bacterium]|nr:hypothetical protein [Pirellulaceae bacterium]
MPVHAVDHPAVAVAGKCSDEMGIDACSKLSGDLRVTEEGHLPSHLVFQSLKAALHGVPVPRLPPGVPEQRPLRVLFQQPLRDRLRVFRQVPGRGFHPLVIKSFPVRTFIALFANVSLR